MDHEPSDEATSASLDRIRRVWARAWPFVFFAVLIVAFAPRAFAGQAVLGPVDMLEPMSPYRESIDRPPSVVSVTQTDQVEGLPMVISFYRDLRQGRLQLYTPRVSGGAPTGTLPLSGLYSPFHIGYLLGPEWYAPAVRVGLALFVSMMFMYLFLRDLRLSKYACVLGAIAFTFNGTNMVLLDRVMAVFLLPAFLWAVARALRRPTAGSVGLVAFFTAWMWVEGFPSGVVFALAIGGLYTAVRVVDLIWHRRSGSRAADALTAPIQEELVPAAIDRRSRFERVGRIITSPAGRGVLVGIGVAWGVALAAMTLLPFAAALSRSGVLDGRLYDSTSHLPPHQVFSLVDVQAGSPPLPVPWWTGVTPVEGGSLVGLIVLLAATVAMILAALGRVRVRAREARVVWTLFCILVPLLTVAVFVGGPLLGLLYRLPGLGQGPISRIRYVIAFGFVVIAAIGFDSVTSTDRTNDRPAYRVSRWAGPVGLVVFGAVMIGAWPSFWSLAAEGSMRATIGRSVLFGLALAVAAALVTVAVRRVPKAAGPATVVIGVLLFVQLAVPFRQFTPSSPTTDFYPETESHRELQRLTDRGDRFRFAASGSNFYPNSAIVNDLSDLRGVAVAPSEFRDLILAANPSAFARDPLKLILQRDEWSLASPIYDEMALGYFALGENEEPFGTTVVRDTLWNDWTKPGVERSVSFVLPPNGEVAGIFLALRLDGADCSQGRATVALSDRSGHSVSAWRPSRDVDTNWIPFALAGGSLDRDGPLSVSVGYDGPGPCAIDVGTVSGDTESGESSVRPALRWKLDDPLDGVRLAATEGAWIYERPTAQGLVSAHSRWTAVADRQAATLALVTRQTGDPYRGVIVGPTPEWVRDDEAGAAQITRADVGDDETRLSVDAEGTALVAYRENYTEDWKATVDGADVPIQRLNGAQLAVFVPRGHHEVVFRYRPASFYRGVIISALAAVPLLVIAMGTLVSAMRRRRSGLAKDSHRAGLDRSSAG